MPGIVLQVSLSPGGIPKRPVASAFLGPTGFDGDRHAHPAIHGGPEKAVLLIDAEVVDGLAGCGYPVFPGALGENLTVRGLDRRQWRAGQQYRVGGAMIELTRIRVPCTTLDIYGPGVQTEIYDAQVQAGDPASLHWAMSGFYARVLRPGFVRADDPIMLIAASV